MRVCDNGTFRDATIAEMDEAAKAQAEEEAAELNREPTPEERLSIMEDAFAELCEVIFNG